MSRLVCGKLRGVFLYRIRHLASWPIIICIEVIEDPGSGNELLCTRPCVKVFTIRAICEFAAPRGRRLGDDNRKASATVGLLLWEVGGSSCRQAACPIVVFQSCFAMHFV